MESDCESSTIVDTFQIPILIHLHPRSPSHYHSSYRHTTAMLKSLNTFIFGLTPEERVRKWQAHLRREQRGLDREIRQLEQATTRTKGSLKQVAKRNDSKSCRILAKEIVRSNKQKERLLASKVQLNSIAMQLGSQLSTIKVTGSLQKSTEIMKLSSSLIKLPQLSGTMSQMSEEMMKVRRSGIRR